MAQSLIMTGAQVKVYINGKLWKECQSVNYTIDYGQESIFGVDSWAPQEISPGRVTVQGSLSGIYINASGGLQGNDITPRITQILYQPYISLRLKDRKVDKDIFFCPQIVITSESTTVGAKGTVKVNFSFRGIIPYSAIDLA